MKIIKYFAMSIMGCVLVFGCSQREGVEYKGEKKFLWIPAATRVNKIIKAEVFYKDRVIFERELSLRKIQNDGELRKYPHKNSGLGISCFVGKNEGLRAGFSIDYKENFEHEYFLNVSYTSDDKKFEIKELVPIDMENKKEIKPLEDVRVSFTAYDKK